MERAQDRLRAGQGSAVHLRLVGHSEPVGAVAIHDTVVASGGDDRTVRLWNAADGEPLATLTGHTAPVVALAFGDGTVLASASEDGTVRLWNPATREHLHTITLPGGIPSALAFLPGPVLVTATTSHWPAGGQRRTGSVDRWDPATGEHLGEFHDDEWVESLAVVQVGDRTLLADLDTQLGEVRLWDPATGEKLSSWEWDNPWPQQLDFDHASLEPPVVAGVLDGRVVVGAVALAECGGFEPDNTCGGLTLWDAETHEVLEQTDIGWDRSLLSADGRGLWASVVFHRDQWSRHVTKGPNVAVGRLGGKAITVLGGHDDAVLDAAFGTVAGRAVLVTAGEDGTVRVWDAAPDAGATT